MNAVSFQSLSNDREQTFWNTVLAIRGRALQDLAAQAIHGSALQDIAAQASYALRNKASPLKHYTAVRYKASLLKQYTAVRYKTSPLKQVMRCVPHFEILPMHRDLAEAARSWASPLKI